jgi:hypothetical protein
MLRLYDILPMATLQALVEDLLLLLTQVLLLLTQVQLLLLMAEAACILEVDLPPITSKLSYIYELHLAHLLITP